jgi:hypothetical protein
VLGTYVTNRTTAELHRTIGFIANLVAVRIAVDCALSTIASSDPHAPLERILDAVGSR